jgi:predicted CoA-substrate-specific enzyme activase
MLIGLDVGSRAAKAAYYSGDGYEFRIVSSQNWEDLLRDKEGVVVSTGYFRKRVPHDFNVTEITTAIYGVRRFIKRKVDVIIDIGGQDTKVIDIERNDFRMNDKCSAGTGTFLEYIASYFALDVAELAKLHRLAKCAAPINSTCSVFAQSEIVSRLVEGYTKEEVIKGVHHAFAKRIAQMVPRRARSVAVIGGTAKNRGVVEALSKELGVRVFVPEDPQVVNAVGAVEYYLAREGER